MCKSNYLNTLMTLFEISYSMKSLILILIALGLLSFSEIQKYSKHCMHLLFYFKSSTASSEVHNKKITNNKISTHTYTSSHIQIAYIALSLLNLSLCSPSKTLIFLSFLFFLWSYHNITNPSQFSNIR